MIIIDVPCKITYFEKDVLKGAVIEETLTLAQTEPIRKIRKFDLIACGDVRSKFSIVR